MRFGENTAARYQVKSQMQKLFHYKYLTCFNSFIGFAGKSSTREREIVMHLIKLPFIMDDSGFWN